MKTRLITLRYINVLLTATLPFLGAAIVTMPNLLMGGHWGTMNWLMQPLAGISILLSPIAWLILVIMGIGWAHNKRLHKSIPILGLATGPISVVPWVGFLLPVLFLLPAIILAVRLVFFHLGKPVYESTG